jgi:hypothetical protein
VAIPVIADHFQAQWIWEGPSGLPEDVYVTTWYFRGDGQLSTPADYGAIIETVLTAFWNQQNGTAPNKITDFLPDELGSCRIKVYDLGETTPRYPVYEAAVAGVAGQYGPTPLPYEVACVNSYYAGQGPRLRGRNYIGPLGLNAIEASANGTPRVASALRTTITESCLNVLNTSENVTWVQVSTTYGVATPVIGGWVDDAFDTQRRRGTAPSTRLTWGAPAA